MDTVADYGEREMRCLRFSRERRERKQFNFVLFSQWDISCQMAVHVSFYIE